MLSISFYNPYKNYQFYYNYKISHPHIEQYQGMYSNYLAEVGKLVFIIGEIETTSSFKKLLDTNNDQKNKFFFKCLDELPVGTYKKINIQCRRKGILRCDWFNKILDRSPLMIFMVFNFSNPLDANQKWEDRLSMALKRINKVYDILRSSNKEEVILRVVIIISKEAVLQSMQTGNIIDKITTFLKTYQKQLSVYQSDQLSKEINKNKTYWFTLLDKAYDRKYRSISKRKEQSFGERRLGCIIKMAVVTEILSKKDSYLQYEEAYRALHFRFMEITKNKLQFINYDTIREVRTLSDIVLLRKLIVKMLISNNFQTVADSITNHMKLFYHHSQNEHFFFSYETMMWRQNFLHNLLEVLYTNDHVQVIPKSYFAQMINTAISLSYKLCKSSLQIQPFLRSQVKGRMIPSEKQLYIGSRNYSMGLEITDLDVLWTEMNELIDRNKDFITRGLQTITRYKSMKLFKKHEVNFFNIYLLRFYLADDKFSSIGNIFNEIIRLKIAQYDFYSLNYLIDQLQKQSEKSSEHRILIHSLAALIADYFKNKDQLQKFGEMLMSILPNKINKSDTIDLLSGEETSQSSLQIEPQKDPLILPLPSQSFIFSMEVLFLQKMHPIQKELEITVIPRFNNNFLLQSHKKGKLKIFFNKSKINYEKQIDFRTLESESKIIIKIDPLAYFTHDESFQIKSAVLITETNPSIHFLIQNITFSRHRSVMMVTKLKMPEINISLPYQILYLNEIIRFKIYLTNVDKATKVEANFSVSEQPSTNNTQIYKSIDERMNLTNSHCFQVISPEAVNVFYLKPNKIGTKVVKFLFNMAITQQIGDKQLKDQNIFHKQIGFKVNSIFKTLKVLKQSKTGHEIKPNQIPTNKNIIMSYNIRATENIKILQLGHHKSPKPYFKTYKNIKTITDYNITPDQKLNSVYIFQVLEQELKAEQKKQLFLISFYIKWSRIDMDRKLSLNSQQFPEIVNLYNEDEVKISLKSDKVEVQYEEGKTLRKRQKETLSIKYRNLTNRKIHVYSIMDNSEEILRIGSRGIQIQLGPKETRVVTFQILPVKSGYYKYPNVRSFFDGLEAKEKTSSSIICVV